MEKIIKVLFIQTQISSITEDKLHNHGICPISCSLWAYETGEIILENIDVIAYGMHAYDSGIKVSVNKPRFIYTTVPEYFQDTNDKIFSKNLSAETLAEKIKQLA